MSNKETQVEDLLRTLTSLASELEILVERNKTAERIESLNNNNVSNNRDFTKHKTLNSPLRLNIGGKVFTATWKMLSQHLNTRLGRLSTSNSLEEALLYSDGYNTARNEFFFNRRNRNFEEILDFYRTGSLHIRNVYNLI